MKKLRTIIKKILDGKKRKNESLKFNIKNVSSIQNRLYQIFKKFKIKKMLY